MLNVLPPNISSILSAISASKDNLRDLWDARGDISVRRKGALYVFSVMLMEMMPTKVKDPKKGSLVLKKGCVDVEQTREVEATR